MRKPEQRLTLNMIRSPISAFPIDTPVDAHSEVATSHLSQTFCPRFSKRDSISEEDDSCHGTSISLEGSPCSPSRLHANPSKHLDSVKSEDSPPITPTLLPPKRPCVSPDSVPTSPAEKLLRRAPRMSLNFDSPKKSARVENEAQEMGCSSFDDHILPGNLIQSIQEKERTIREEQDPAISQARRRKQMINGLPKLFNMMIHFSLKRSVITKEELIHKILVGRCDIVDRREVEEQLNLLMELAPEWISEKTVFSGDLLIWNIMMSPESIRARLEESI